MNLPLSKLGDQVLLRFWSKVRVTPHCWEWQAGLHPYGYGVFTVGTGDQRLAHRFSYEVMHGGPIPKGLVVRHRCDNPPCVNPAHLELGTHADNMRDKVARGRQRRGPAMSKLTIEQVRTIRAAPDGTVARLARGFGITPQTASRIRNGHSWTGIE